MVRRNENIKYNNNRFVDIIINSIDNVM